ncbi:MAG: large repetitive protein [Mycobacterium sp.]|jgi:hypothetical protein|nr:large repetitive protein [Mycobacterium sp.]
MRTSSVTTKTKSTIAASAMAVGALGFLILPAAHADPMIPLAPPSGGCTQFSFAGDINIVLGSGNRFVFSGSGTSVDRTVTFIPNDGTPNRSGTITGNIKGRNVSMQTIVGKDIANFTGTVDDAGIARGSVSNKGTSFTTVSWDVQQPLLCADAAKPDQKKPTAAKDTDGDGLSDADELKFFTNVFLPDTDFDGVSDGDEIKNRTNPVNALSK